MMALLLVILVPLAALVIYAIAFDLRRRRRRGATRSHDISSAARMARTDADAHGASGLSNGLSSRDPGSGSATFL
jgi:hypothetical protein